ncbi:hypothetical protein C5167_022375, partial [Papaver somniferum]
RRDASPDFGFRVFFKKLENKRVLGVRAKELIPGYSEREALSMARDVCSDALEEQIRDLVSRH